jgi:hypothetical protein
LRFATPADLLVNVEADLAITDGDRVVFAEKAFPIAELARGLTRWVAAGGGDGFAFDSMSYEDPGSVRVARRPDGWVFGSDFTPEVWSEPLTWDAVVATVEAFAQDVRADLRALGLDPALVGLA